MELSEAGLFLGFFEDLPDARQRGKVRYPLTEVLLLCLLVVLSGAETITDIANFGVLKWIFLAAASAICGRHAIARSPPLRYPRDA